MSDKQEPHETDESAGSSQADMQENHNPETEEDTASGGAAADPDPQDL